MVTVFDFIIFTHLDLYWWTVVIYCFCAYLAFPNCILLDLVITGLKKALKNAASHSQCTGSLTEWTPAIVNHMYWCAASTEKSPNSADIIEAKWRSILNHVLGKHSHQSPLYPKCLHGKRTRNQKKKKYMKKGVA